MRSQAHSFPSEFQHRQDAIAGIAEQPVAIDSNDADFYDDYDTVFPDTIKLLAVHGYRKPRIIIMPPTRRIIEAPFRGAASGS